MSDSLFLGASDLGWLVDAFGTFVAYGLGLGFVVWVVGYVVAFVMDVLRF